MVFTLLDGQSMEFNIPHPTFLPSSEFKLVTWPLFGTSAPDAILEWSKNKK